MKTNQTFGLIFASILSGGLYAQSAGNEFVPFEQFLERTRTTSSRSIPRAGAHANGDPAIEEMRQHVLNRYEGVQVKHSFVLGSSHFDCVPVTQQPSMRALALTSAAPAPPQELLVRPSAESDPAAEGPTTPAAIGNRTETSDRFGNSFHCEAGTIPMRRTTLEDLAQFPTLRDYFKKGPNSAGHALQNNAAAEPAADLSKHRYSRMCQSVNNLGGNSNLNIWSPYVDTSRGQEFTLSQEWYMGGTGDAMQTVEVGWQNYPDFWGDNNARLFIYWTADDYKSTGCYNLDCDAFVQTNTDIALGADFGSNYSTPGGTQYEFSAQFRMYQGNWWLAIQGTWVGYYPGSIFRGGQMTKFAEEIQFGTESLASSASWPGEGSGEWSTKGYGQSAYQRNLFYIDSNGKAVWDTLTQWITSPACYSVSGPYSNQTAGWNVFFYEGGPGGNCQ